VRGEGRLCAHIEELLPDVLEGKIEPGRVFDQIVTLDEVPDGYRAMADRASLTVLIRDDLWTQRKDDRR
jgi:threonine dehydrogenase-like Zn-dependent dehydrogenase